MSVFLMIANTLPNLPWIFSSCLSGSGSEGEDSSKSARIPFPQPERQMLPLQDAEKNVEVLPPNEKVQSIRERALGFIRSELIDNPDIPFKTDPWNDYSTYFSNWWKGTCHSADLCSKSESQDDWFNFFVFTMEEIDDAVINAVTKGITWATGWNNVAGIIGNIIGIGVYLITPFALIYYLLKKLVLQPGWSLTKILVRTAFYLCWGLIGLGVLACKKGYQAYLASKEKKEKARLEEYNRPAMISFKKEEQEGYQKLEKASDELVAVLQNTNSSSEERNKVFKEMAEATVFRAHQKAKKAALKEVPEKDLDAAELFKVEELTRSHFYKELQNVHIVEVRTDIRHRLGKDADEAIAILERHLLEAAVDDFIKNIHLYKKEEQLERAKKELEAVFTFPVTAFKPVRREIENRIERITLNKGLQEGQRLLQAASSNLMAILSQPEATDKNREKGFKELAATILYCAQVNAKEDALKAADGKQEIDVAKVIRKEEKLRPHFYEELNKAYNELKGKHLGKASERDQKAFEAVLLEAAIDDFFENIDLYTVMERRDKAIKQLMAVFYSPETGNRQAKKLFREKIVAACELRMKSCDNIVYLLKEQQKVLERLKEKDLSKVQDIDHQLQLHAADMLKRNNDMNILWANYERQILRLENLLILSLDPGLQVKEPFLKSSEAFLQKQKEKAAAKRLD